MTIGDNGGGTMILSTVNDLPGYQVTDVNEIQNIGQEICAYGTAVKIRPAD